MVHSDLISLINHQIITGAKKMDNKDQIIANLKNQVTELEKTAALLVELNRNSQDAINSLKEYFENSQKILDKLTIANNNAINSGLEVKKQETKLIEISDEDLPPAAATNKPSTPPPATNKPSTPPPATNKPSTPPPATNKPPSKK